MAPNIRNCRLRAAGPDSGREARHSSAVVSFSEAAIVAFGAGMGGAARHAVTNFFARAFGAALPWGTIAVNVLGSFAIGIAAATLARGTPLWLLAATGVLGGFTTVASFSVQTLFLARDRNWSGVAANIGLSLIGGLGGVALGFALFA
jgi:fluoride exporter